jgi:putative effector of murein hydrolase LrgA (UPF0299 family)
MGSSLSGSWFSWVALAIIVLKYFSVTKGKSKRIKFPNLWLIPCLFIIITVQDCLSTSWLSIGSLAALMGILAIGLLVGIFRGRSLKYYKEDDGHIYYQESYQSLILYILLIAVKWIVRELGGQNPSTTIISLLLLSFGCGSIVGRSLFVTSKYLLGK